MRKIIFSVLATGMLFAADKINYLPKKEVMSLLKILPFANKIISQYKSGELNIYVQKKDGFYVVMLKGQRRGEFFITKDKRYVIFGNIYDLKKHKNVMGNFPINKKIVEKGVAFTYGTGKKDIYLVTDPQCPFCRMLEAKKGNMLEKKYRIHVILYPLPFHQYAKPMTEYILAGKNDKEKAARLLRILHGSNEWKNFKPTPKEKEKLDEKIREMQRAADELGVQGTPSIYNSNFKPISLEKIYNEK